MRCALILRRSEHRGGNLLHYFLFVYVLSSTISKGRERIFFSFASNFVLCVGIAAWLCCVCCQTFGLCVQCVVPLVFVYSVLCLLSCPWFVCVYIMCWYFCVCVLKHVIYKNFFYCDSCCRPPPILAPPCHLGFSSPRHPSCHRHCCCCCSS